MQDSIQIPSAMCLSAQKAWLHLTGERERLSAGMAGVERVAFQFSEDWDGLQKTAVFSNGMTTVDVPEEAWDNGICTVPCEVLAAAGKTVMVGVYGSNGVHLVLPTVWCVLGRVEPGAVPAGVTAQPAEAPLWARLQRRLSAAEPFTVTAQTAGEAVTPDKTLSEITAAAQAGRPVVLSMNDCLLPLTRLVEGERAEFTGPVFRQGETDTYSLCTITAAAATAVTRQVTQLPELVVTISRSTMNNALSSSAAIGQVWSAYEEGRKIILEDFWGRKLPLVRIAQNFAQFCAAVWNSGDDCFNLVSYLLDTNGVTVQSIDAADAANVYTKAQSDAQLAEIEARDQLLVTLTRDAQTDAITADKTIAEIYAAYSAGKIIKAKEAWFGRELPLQECAATYAQFCSTLWVSSDEEFVSHAYTIDANGVTTNGMVLPNQNNTYTKSQVDAIVAAVAPGTIGAQAQAYQDITGTDSITADCCEAGSAKALTITGKSVQDGTPTLAVPIPIEAVGDLVESGEHSGKYAIPVTIANAAENPTQTITKTLYLDEPLRQGDTLELVGGKLIKRRAGKVFDGTESYSLCDSNSVKCNDITLPAKAFASTVLYSAFCSHCVSGIDYISAYSVQGNQMEFRKIVANWGIPNYSLDDWVSFVSQQYAAGMPVTVDYELATPIEIDLTGQDIPAYAGTTIVTVGTETKPSAIAANLPCNTKAYVDKKFAELSALILEG